MCCKVNGISESLTIAFRGHRHDGEAHAIHGDRAERDRDLRDRGRNREVHHDGILPPRHRPHRPQAIHVALHDVSAEPVADPERALQVDPVPDGRVGEAGPVERGVHDVDGEPAAARPHHREAGAVDRDALAALDAAERRGDDELESAPRIATPDGWCRPR